MMGPFTPRAFCFFRFQQRKAQLRLLVVYDFLGGVGKKLRDERLKKSQAIVAVLVVSFTVWDSRSS